MTRAERRTRTETVVARRKRDWLISASHDRLLRRGEAWDSKRAGRSRKLHPFDCGRPRCGICTRHWDPIRPRDLRALLCAEGE